MVTLLITALAIIFIIGIGLYFWQKPRTSAEYVLPPKPDPRLLFAEQVSADDADERLALESQQREDIVARAKQGERAALKEARSHTDNGLYDQVMAELIARADSSAKLLALTSFVTENELPVNLALARAVTSSWLAAPDRGATSKALHIAALSDDPEIYSQAVERALELWRTGKLTDISAAELRALFDGEFWILSSRSRGSGAGFILKRTLAAARRELEAAGANE
jgi:hypothetical protein